MVTTSSWEGVARPQAQTRARTRLMLHKPKTAIGSMNLNGRNAWRQSAAVASISNIRPGIAKRVTPNKVIGGAT